MGGHGGLNILPQKSWHVYNQDNREKVKRDELKHEEEERLRKAKHDAAESEHRRQILLQRARGGHQLAAAQDAEPTSVDAVVLREASAVAQRSEAPAGHINFWQQDELRMGNHEKKAEQKDERRRRGDAATQTSDARFDERFQMAHGLLGKARQPWYVQPSLLSEAERQELDGTQLQPGSVVTFVEAGGQRTVSASEPADPLQAVPSSKKHKHKHKHKGSDKDKRSSKKRLKARAATSDLDRLRAERRQREAVERARQLHMLRQSHRT